MRSLVGIFLVFCIPAGAMADSDNVGVPDSGVELGLGWDSQLARVVPNRCIEFAPVREQGQTLNMTLSEVSDTSDVMDKLNVSAGMSIRTMFGSGSAQAEFATTSKVNSSSNSLLIRATVANGVLFVGPSRPLVPARTAYPPVDAQPPVERESLWFLDEDGLHDQIVLTGEAVDILGDGSAREIREFERHCGDSFVSAIYSGAELIAISSFQSTKSSVAKAVKSKLEGEFSAFGVQGDVTAEMSAEEKREVANTQLEVSYTQIGGAGGIIPTEKAAFINKLETLPLEALKGPQFHTMDITPYTDLADWPQRISLEVGDDPIEAGLTNYYWTFTSIDGLLEEIKKNQTAYGIEADRLETLEILQDTIGQYRQDIYRILQRTYALAGKQSEYSVFFGLFQRRDKDLEARLEALEADKRTLHQRLVDFSFGVENPNLVKLLLPVPGSAADAVSHYIAPQSRRVCRTSPVSGECMTNSMLTALLSCVPSAPDWIMPDRTCWQSPLAEVERDRVGDRAGG